MSALVPWTDVLLWADTAGVAWELLDPGDDGDACIAILQSIRDGRGVPPGYAARPMDRDAIDWTDSMFGGAS